VASSSANPNIPVPYRKMAKYSSRSLRRRNVYGLYLKPCRAFTPNMRTKSWVIGNLSGYPQYTAHIRRSHYSTLAYEEYVKELATTRAGLLSRGTESRLIITGGSVSKVAPKSTPSVPPTKPIIVTHSISLLALAPARACPHLHDCQLFQGNLATHSLGSFQHPPPKQRAPPALKPLNNPRLKSSFTFAFSHRTPKHYFLHVLTLCR
jgi:hypothetical protein